MPRLGERGAAQTSQALAMDTSLIDLPQGRAH